VRPKSVEEHEARFLECRSKYGDDALKYSFLAGILRSIIESPVPAEWKVQEARNAMIAFDRLRDRWLRGEIPADPDPQPAG